MTDWFSIAKVSIVCGHQVRVTPEKLVKIEGRAPMPALDARHYLIDPLRLQYEREKKKLDAFLASEGIGG